MANSNRKKRLEFLSKKNEGRRLLPDVAIDLAQRLGQDSKDLCFADLEETDVLLQRLRMRDWSSQEAARQRKNGMYLRTENAQMVRDLLSKIRATYHPCPLVWLHERSEFTGGLRTDLATVLEEALEIVQLDGEDMIAVSPDFATGLTVEFFTDRTESGVERVYRVTSWQE